VTVGGPGVMDRLVVVDLFSGAGGLSEGFRAAGFHVALAVEKDPYAAETNYFNHSRNKSKFRTRVLTADIADVDFVKERKLLRESLGKPPEVVIGGPPCQGFSRANMRTRTSKNPLNALVLDFVEAVKAMRPLVALLENVADIEKFEDGDTVELLGYAFDDIGYSFNSAVLNAADFGVPQRRRRFIGIATRYGITVTLPKPYHPTHGLPLAKRSLIFRHCRTATARTPSHTGPGTISLRTRRQCVRARTVKSRTTLSPVTVSSCWKGMRTFPRGGIGKTFPIG